MPLPLNNGGCSLPFREKSLRGFSLVELIMTIVIVAIVSVPLSLLISQHFEGVLQSKDYTAGVNLARLEMEKVNNLSYNAISTGSFSNYQGYPYDVSRDVIFLVGDNLSQESLNQVTVSVRRSGSAAVIVKFITYIAKNVTYGL